ncbi:hypothetical protein ONS95_002325 [Cadophora gregata]|uniref:uncharacterized protein n=1 Tax=Cadophora gregata TaxID=51156 RepID=UPI0026DD5C66|nr:uncharacterized protein ONS95_002325 [Cadophora gregata]KAK0109644.1 hypothetical protein ONS95_002325 [Cadophora gregata]KAK0110725.1 hypothetical protein ONS96_002324 [Cadophora gregata f. sp. sojae]
MSAHHHHSPLTPQPKTPTFHSRINRHALTSSNSPTSPSHHHLTPSELLILIFALGVLVALVSWLVWIMVEFCITFVKEKVDDMDFGKRMRRDRHRAEQAPKKALDAGVVFTRMGLGGLAEIGGRIFGGRRNGENGHEGHGEGCEEGRGLLGEEREGNGARCGYGIFDGRQGYGYHEGMLYPSGTGPDRLKYADGASESSGCVGPLHGHREECVGECTLQTRRRSRES